MKVEDFIKEHFPGLEKETWYPVIVAVAEGYHAQFKHPPVSVMSEGLVKAVEEHIKFLQNNNLGHDQALIEALHLIYPQQPAVMSMNRQKLMDAIEEIQNRNYSKFKGSNEADLMCREEIADLFETTLTVMPSEELVKALEKISKLYPSGEYELPSSKALKKAKQIALNALSALSKEAPKEQSKLFCECMIPHVSSIAAVCVNCNMQIKPETTSKERETAIEWAKENGFKWSEYHNKWYNPNTARCYYTEVDIIDLFKQRNK